VDKSGSEEMGETATQERIAIITVEAKIPVKWAEWLAMITTMPKPVDYMDARWQRIKNDACLLIDKWHNQITKNGWGVNDIKGLIVVIDGNPVINVGRGDVTVKVLATGTEEKIFWRPNPGKVARWDFGRRKA